MRNVLVLFAHPRYEHSVVNKALINGISKIPAVTINDLYEVYPNFNINREKEKELLLKNDIIIWHHPFYWYSCPPLLKQWIDVVLEYNWAYGHNGNNLKGKFIFNAITTGGTSEAYQQEGKHGFTLHQMLKPFELTARLCKMIYLPPFAIQGTHKMKDHELEAKANLYKDLLIFLTNDSSDIDSLGKDNLLNDHFLEKH